MADTKSFDAEGNVTEGPREFSDMELESLAQQVYAESWDRKDRRKHREAVWDEADRQVEMEPDPFLKKEAYGRNMKAFQWIPQMELPFQAQALEVLTGDTNALLFPTTKNWFQAHANVDDEFLRKLRDEADFIQDVVVDPNQGDVDEIVEAFLYDVHRRYDMRNEWDRFNAGAFKYGVGVGRVRKVKKRVLIEKARGVEPVTEEFPVFLADSIRDVLLDDNCSNIQKEGLFVGPVQMRCYKQNKFDLLMAANSGTSDPDDMIKGGWLLDEVKKLLKEIEDGPTPQAELVEAEGDIIVSHNKGGDPFYLPGAVVTVGHGCNKDKKSFCRVVRLRFTQLPFSSYITQAYDVTNIDSPYTSGPLTKGAHIQKMASLAANMLAAVGVLNAVPYVTYDPNDPFAEAAGGPVIQPGTSQPVARPDSIIPHKIGDISGQLQMFGALVQQYADLVGVLPARLGAQTKSHTSAFAKDAELQRGASRTVAYAKRTQENGMTQFLNKEYYIARQFRGTRTILMPKRKSFIDIKSAWLPKEAEFDVFGAAGPAVEAASTQEKQVALQTVLQLEIAKRQLDPEGSQERRLDIQKLQEKFLEDAGITDTEELFDTTEPGLSGDAAGQPQFPGLVVANPQQS